LREGQAMARVAHPNVTAVCDVGRHGDQVFVAMEPCLNNDVVDNSLNAAPSPRE
jgi:hypothetical protein